MQIIGKKKMIQKYAGVNGKIDRVPRAKMRLVHRAGSGERGKLLKCQLKHELGSHQLFCNNCPSGKFLFPVAIVKQLACPSTGSNLLTFATGI